MIKMIATSLLEKTRYIRKTLQKENVINFSDVITVLKNVINANVFIVNNACKILRYALIEDFECKVMRDDILEKGEFPEYYHKYLLKVGEGKSKVNLLQEGNGCVFAPSARCLFTNIFTMLVPVLGQGQTLGTLILARMCHSFDTGDLILAETAATVIGMEILKARSNEAEEETRQKAVAKQALRALSYSELEAAVRIFSELDREEGLLVASKIADQLGITRSVTVNALRKLKSAGVIESHSLGMKGTFLKVLNPYLVEQLQEEWA